MDFILTRAQGRSATGGEPSIEPTHEARLGRL